MGCILAAATRGVATWQSQRQLKIMVFTWSCKCYLHGQNVIFMVLPLRHLPPGLLPTHLCPLLCSCVAVLFGVYLPFQSHLSAIAWKWALNFLAVMEQETTTSYAAESSTSDIWKQLPIAFSCIVYTALLPRTAVTRDRRKNDCCCLGQGERVFSLNFEQLQYMFLTPFIRNCKWDTCLGKQSLHGCTPCR